MGTALSLLCIAILCLCAPSGGVVIHWRVVVWQQHGLELPLVIDFIRVVFAATVSLIARQVYIFSSSYIVAEKHSVRFHLLVLRFVFSMYTLIFVPHLVFVLLGWDGLGITSYLLVIYFNSRKSFNAGLLTALTNRLGDRAILILIATFAQAGSLSYGLTNSLAMPGLWPMPLLIFAACTKRAQLPFSAWLPAAMAAPTPVSALVHSSTLVTAGVYLLVRYNSLLQRNNCVAYLYVLGTLTMFIAGLAAIGEMDIKKVVALSTLSQLGVIICTLGAGWPQVAFFHLILHAFFKAVLFIVVGYIIHRAADYQDMRIVGILPQRFPVLLAAFTGANLSLCGAPFTRGFFSKDMCIELIATTSGRVLLMLLFYVATLLTAAYSWRLAKVVFLKRSLKRTIDFTEDTDHSSVRATFILFTLRIVGGAWLRSWAGGGQDINISSDIKRLTILVISAGVVVGRKPHALVSVATTLKVRGAIVIWFLPWVSSSGGSLTFLMSGQASRSYIDLKWTESIIAEPGVAVSTSGLNLEKSVARVWSTFTPIVTLIAVLAFYIY